MKPTPSRSQAGSSSSSAVAGEPRVLALLGDERRQPALGGDRVRLLDHRRREVGGADRAHRALLHELVERAERLLDRRHAVGTVVLVEVDPVGLQPPQRCLDRLADVGARTAGGLAVAEVVPELRREHDLVAPAGERAADDLLAAAPVAVDVRGVEERDARVERGVDHRARSLLVDPAAEVVAAEADDGHLEIGAAEPPRAHREQPRERHVGQRKRSVKRAVRIR